MLDNLRDQASSSSYPEEDILADIVIPEDAPKKKSGPFLGMTPAQRFIIAFILFFMVCVLGVLFLMITGKMSPSFFG